VFIEGRKRNGEEQKIDEKWDRRNMEVEIIKYI
jgi:hypothetical protein